MNSAVYIIRGNQSTISAVPFCLGFLQIRNEVRCEFGVREQNKSLRPVCFIKVEQKLSNAIRYMYIYNKCTLLVFLVLYVILVIFNRIFFSLHLLA
jgi:hypothetical protein